MEHIISAEMSYSYSEDEKATSPPLEKEVIDIQLGFIGKYQRLLLEMKPALD